MTDRSSVIPSGARHPSSRQKSSILNETLPLLDAELNVRVGVMCTNQKSLMSKESLTASALMLLLACFSHPAWSQESTGLKKIRIGMPNRGVPNLGLPAAQRFGFFQAQGLAAELIVMRPSVSLQTLLAGEIRRRRRLPMFCRAKGNQRSEARKVTDAFCWISLGEICAT